MPGTHTIDARECRQRREERCSGVGCADGKFARCGRYEPIPLPKTYGVSILVRLIDGSTREFHRRGVTDNGIRRIGMRTRGFKEIVRVDQVSEEQWINGYGNPAYGRGL